MKLLRNSALPLRLRKKIGKIMGPPRSGIFFAVDLFGARYEGITGNHQDNKIYIYGAHEPATIRLMRAIADSQKDPVYMDIGTNTGQHLTALSNTVNAAYGFEPWPAVRERAERNIKNNGLAHVKIFPFGLSNRTAEETYYPPAGNNLGVGSFVKSGNASGTVLSLRRGDDFVRQENLKPTLIKIDTEGYEKKVLEGLRDCLAAHRPVVVFEYDGLTKKELAELKDIKALFPEDYEIYGIRPSREQPSLEIFKTGRRYENLLAWPGPGKPPL